MLEQLNKLSPGFSKRGYRGLSRRFKRTISVLDSLSHRIGG
jgi:hypothetical protein